MSDTPRTDAELLRILNELAASQAKLSTVFQWISRNHPDGFIDSLTHLQNLERVTDLHHDRLDAAERELAASQAGQAKWQAEAARLSSEREHNAYMAGMWQALAEGLASRLNLWHNAAGNRCNVQDAAALAAYEAAKAGVAAEA